jgi:hypothetical protein
MVTKFIMYTNPSGKIIRYFCFLSVRIRPSPPTYIHVTIRTHAFPHISTPPRRPPPPRARPPPLSRPLILPQSRFQHAAV